MFVTGLTELKEVMFDFTVTALVSGGRRALLSCDASSDGLTVAAGTDLKGEDASILYW